ncbi:P-loop containing nucleoside triphosphate hydrolase protein [Fomitopsis serialis]|uniref:P-loop containing nucleoside triphosphate hydrolase protein n=1 Tax=Fomitopsis serialis TaxID=139415 RepID=UPI0020075B7B|nr:P-loop containing nucleoside triphosphate hydrolase protein [Neoantrodia serialis]KAH9911255.1 P-loop containing nucleoside triphosphate hydrolase protein [Neoantrodia serialis]
MAPSQSRILSLEQIRETTLAKLGRFPCRWQAHATQVILERKKDLITIAPTGSGKTLTFWMPLLFRADGIQIVVTPLNILGTQNEQELAKFGVRAIAVRAETATPKVFREIREGKYRAIVVNPEELMKVGGGFEDLWNDEGFTSRIMSIVFDEAHCISTWKSFRQDYKNIDRLRYLLPHVPFVLATATLPGEMQHEIMKTLQIRADRCTVIRRSNHTKQLFLTHSHPMADAQSRGTPSRTLSIPALDHWSHTRLLRQQRARRHVEGCDEAVVEHSKEGQSTHHDIDRGQAVQLVEEREDTGLVTGGEESTQSIEEDSWCRSVDFDVEEEAPTARL